MGSWSWEQNLSLRLGLGRVCSALKRGTPLPSKGFATSRRSARVAKTEITGVAMDMERDQQTELHRRCQQYSVKVGRMEPCLL